MGLQVAAPVLVIMALGIGEIIAFDINYIPNDITGRVINIIVLAIFGWLFIDRFFDSIDRSYEERKAFDQ